MRQHTALERELAELVVRELNLQEVSPDGIDPDAPLFGEGLGLDSIDALELALAISKAYGVKIRSSDEHNVEIFRSLGALSRHVADHRIGEPQA